MENSQTKKKKIILGGEKIRSSLHNTFHQRILLATSTIQNMKSIFQHRCAQQYYKGRSFSFSFHTNRRAEQGKEKVQAVLLFPRVAAVFIRVRIFLRRHKRTAIYS